MRDAEVLEMLATLLDELGISGWTLQLNSVGSAADRARYNEALRAALVPLAPQMCVDCQRRAVTNPLRVLDCKVPADQPIIETLPRIADSLDADSVAHFAAVTAALDAAGVPYTRNHRLVRGLDYYTRTTFEFTHGGLGAQNALLGGGRYDGLSEMIGGPRAPGIGLRHGRGPACFDAAGPGRCRGTGEGGCVYRSAGREHERRRAEPGSGTAPCGAAYRARGWQFPGWKKSFEAADKTARCIILGEDEVKSGILTVKTFATGIQTKVARAELAAFLSE